MKRALPSLALSLGIGFGITGQLANADPILPFNYSENFGLFGGQLNNVCPAMGVCAAISAINSFVFLEKQYPKVYDNKLLPNYDATKNNDPTDARNFATKGWQTDKNPARKGYYTRGDSAKNQDPVWNSDFLATKKDWFNDFAPGTTMFASMWFKDGGYPTLAFLSTEIKNKEDVEFFVKDKTTSGNTIYHALTLTGISCTGKNFTNCSITYQDPNKPTVNQSTMVSLTGPGGSISFTSLPGSGINKTNLYIDAAFAESPIPEPSFLFLVGLALVGLIGVNKRFTRI
jgi:hypothetical protein